MVVVIDSQIAGISGDMLLCSLIDLGADRSRVLRGVDAAKKHLAGSVVNRIDFVRGKKRGTSCTCLELDISESVRERHGTEIRRCLESTLSEIAISDRGKRYALSCIDTLISAESRIHGAPADSVHFHEASSMDTVVDILGSAIALDDLGLFDDEIISTSVAVGGGTVDFSHGTTSNPASAILEIFKGSDISIHGGSVPDELTTPTGACLLVNLAGQSRDFYPPLQVESVGYGGGAKDFEPFANVLKVVRGRQPAAGRTDSVIVLETNVDDVSGEVLGNLIDRLVQSGARDVTISPAITKKNRPTNLITVLCGDGTQDRMADILTAETGTLGIRVRRSDRLVRPRHTMTATATVGDRQFAVRYKADPLTQKILKIEFDDIKSVSDSLGIPLRDAENLVRDRIRQHHPGGG